MSTYPDPPVVGELYTITADAAATANGLTASPIYTIHAAGADASAWPAWLTPTPTSTGLRQATGTPTEAGTWQLQVGEVDRGTWYDVKLFTITAAAPAPTETVIPVPAAQRTEDGYMLPEAEGVRWDVDGTTTAPGSYSVQPVTETTTVTITPQALDGYLFPVAPEPLVLTFEPAPPEPEPEPEPEPPNPEEEWALIMEEDPQAMYVAVRLADRIIRHAGGKLEGIEGDQLVMARDHALTVLEYVKGYTRGQGFVGYIPHRALQAVIVAAGARLYTNPKQVTFYSSGDYSERPATLAGWTMAELAVLRRFRRTYA